MFNESRPWFRVRLAFVVPVAIALGVFGYAMFWAFTAEPVLSTDFDGRLRELSSQAQPPGRNGWPHLAAAGRLTRGRGPCGYTHMMNYNYVGDEQPDATAAECLRRTVAWMANSGVFDHLAAAAECPNAMITDERGGYLGEGERDVAPIATAGRARGLDVYLALARDDPTEAADALGEALYVARALSHQPGGPGPPAAFRVLTTAGSTLHAALMDFSLEAPLLLRFLESVQGMRMGPVALTVEGERLRLNAVVQRTYTDDGHGDGRMLVALAAGRPASPIVNLKSLRYAGRRDLLEKADGYFDRAAEFVDLPRERRAARPLDTNGFGSSLSDRYQLLAGSLPYWLEMHVSHRELAECMYARLTIMIALELHRADHGAYPVSLEALVPATLPALPDDPCADVSPILYRRVAEDPHRRGYLLYGTGGDGEDDLGLDDDAVFNLPASPGAAALREAVAAAQ